jgi:phosphatidylglycerophosphate synthase
MSNSDNSMIAESGRKIEAQYENPIDNFFIAISDKISPAFKRLNFTPNGITTLSAVTGAGALYGLYNKDMTQFTIFALLSYFFDVMDGYYARKYNMTSPGGDKYDHFKDLLMVVIGAYILYAQYNVTSFPIVIVVILVLWFLSLVYVGCQEVITSKDNRSDTLEFAQGFRSVLATMDEDVCKSRMWFMRWFGTGTMAIGFICAVLYLNGNFSGLGSSLSFGESNVVPGSEDLYDRMSSSSDGTLPDTVDTFEPKVVDIRGFNGQSSHNRIFNLNQDDMNFINELRTFGSSTLGSSTLNTGPYSTNMMVDRMIRD